MYRIKTRNWNGKKWVMDLLDWTGVESSDDYGDHDVKYWYETRSAGVAWGIWIYWMLLSHFSGGWTYIVRPGRELIGHDYRSIY